MAERRLDIVRITLGILLIGVQTVRLTHLCLTDLVADTATALVADEECRDSALD